MKLTGKKTRLKKGRELLVLFSFCAFTIAAAAQTNTALTINQILQLAHTCAPRVSPNTILAVVRQESALRPYALSINYPKTEAKRQGYDDGLYELARQPKDKQEAFNWTRWFIYHHLSVSIGLMQVSSLEAHRLGITDLRLLFDPCINIAAGAVVLQDSYRGRPHNLEGMEEAFALYNAGSISLGIADGYASGVVAKATTPLIEWPRPRSSTTVYSHTH